uniref:Uncharacterized protein n=2 Tax=Sphaerodactylus townsendi TaxID=933632 RepID=A0ACB8F4N5_9SAUR
MPLDVQSCGSLSDTTEQTEWDNQLSSYQHYMVLSPSNTQGSSQENEYFDGTDDGSDTFPIPLEHGLSTTSKAKVHLNSLTLCHLPLSAFEVKEEKSIEVSEEQSASPTHISNQTYLLMG